MSLWKCPLCPNDAWNSELGCHGAETSHVSGDTRDESVVTVPSCSGSHQDKQLLCLLCSQQHYRDLAKCPCGCPVGPAGFVSLAAGESSMRGEVEFTLRTPEEAAEVWGRMGRTAGMGQQGWGSRDGVTGMGEQGWRQQGWGWQR